MLDWTTAEWADGPKVAEWLSARIHPSFYPDSVSRALSRWRTGSSASFQALDRVLVMADMHPSELPDDVWREKPANYQRPPQMRRCPQRGRRLTAKQVSRMRHDRMWEDGATYKVLAERYSVSEKTVELICRYRTWVDVKAAAA